MNVLVYIAATIGFLILVGVFLGANGAPQEASGSAMGILLIFIPYSVVRVSQAEKGLAKQDEMIKLLAKLALPVSNQEE